MDLYATAGRAGLNMLAEHLPRVMKQAERVVAGDGFNKVMQRLFPDGLKPGPGRGMEPPPGVAKWFDPHQISPRLSTRQAQDFHTRFDLDKDGQVTERELSQGIKDLEMKMKTLQDKADRTPKEDQELQTLRQQRRFGTALLRNYESVSNLDVDKQGISVNDIRNLANQDQHASNITIKDWRGLVNGAG